MVLFGIPVHKRNCGTKVMGDVIYKPSDTCRKNSIELTNKALTTTTFENNIHYASIAVHDATINKNNRQF